ITKKLNQRPIQNTARNDNKKTLCVDTVGTAIPESLLVIWNRREQVEDLMARVKRRIMDKENLRKSEVKPFTRIDQVVLLNLDTLHSFLKQARPDMAGGICHRRLHETK